MVNFWVLRLCEMNLVLDLKTLGYLRRIDLAVLAYQISNEFLISTKT